MPLEGSEPWGMMRTSVLVLWLLVSLVVGDLSHGVQVEVSEVSPHHQILMDSFPQTETQNEGHHRIRHSHHHHNHRHRSHLPPLQPHVPGDPGEEMIPLFPKNLSETTLSGLRRLKRQFYSQYSSHTPSQVQLYVTEDGSEWRDDGQGLEWSAPSSCSRSCGGGVAVEERVCRETIRADGSCEGGRRFFSCNTEECRGTEDFRAEQCSAFDTVPFEGRYYQWIPYTKAPNKCELNCMPQGERFYYRHKRKVIDGTGCDEENRHVCVDGKCLPVGCDNVLGSRAREDQCRQCGGDGSGCHTVQGVFDSNNNLQVGYNDVLLIPSGATNIFVKERRASNNYLAIRNTSNHYYLNGNWRIDFPRELVFASTTFHYERKPHSFFAPESIRALGPISEALYIVVLYQESNPGIEYEYSISDKEHQIALTTPGSYAWLHDDFSPCSATCGGGMQQRYVHCAKRTEESLEYVEEYLCDMTSRPVTQQSCSNHPCPLQWYTGDWEGCSAKCGSNETGTQRRIVFCEQIVQGSRAIVEDEMRCEVEVGRAPEKVRECTGEVEGGICASWYISEWTGCSSLCGEGEESRQVTCHAKQDNVTNVYDDSHCSEARPEVTRSCNLTPCEGVDWITGPWSGCKATSDPCDTSQNPVETRQVYCTSSKGKVYADDFCHSYRRPNNTRECSSPSEEPSTTESSGKCQYAWFAMQWGECLLKSCSPPEDQSEVKGEKSRLVFCGTLGADLGVTRVEDEEKCNATKKYNATEPCDLEEEFVKAECFEKSAWFTGPWSKCSKECGSGSRSRQVICMVGNESTTDVNKCGEEGIVFTSEDCVGEECATDSTGEELMIVTSVADGSTSPSPMGMKPGVDCEPDYEEEYYDYQEGSATEETTTDLGDGDTTTEMTVGSGDDLGGSGEGMVDSMVSGEGSGESGGDEMMELGKTTAGSDALITSDMATSTALSLSESTATTEATAEEATTEEPTTVEAAPEERRRRRRRDADETEEMTTGGVIYDTEETTTGSVTYDTGDKGNEAGGDPVVDPGEKDDEDMGSGHGSEVPLEPVEPSKPSNSSEDDGGAPGSGDMGSGGMGSGDMGSGEEMGKATSSAPRTTLEEALEEEEIKLPKCPPKIKDEKPVINCSDTSYGCCPNGLDAAKGPFGSGCSIPKTCSETKFGCCSDGVTPAQGKLKLRGCPMPNCTTSLFGCCPDEKTSAEGNDLLGCQKHCDLSEFGCCPDGKTPKKGPKGKGCPKVKCEDTKFGCCPGKKKQKDKGIATGPLYEGCKEINKKNCSANYFGCCLDGKTASLGEKGEGCPEMPPCFTEEFGCCDDEVTSAHGPNMEGCCLSSQFGCCPDNIQPASGPNLGGCTCKNSLYGCCPDNSTAARGPEGQCGCKFTEHGCCPDGYTDAKGKNHEGCPCSTFQLGCCPDGVSVAKGPNKEGCGCEHTEFGCCPDRRTPKDKADDSCGCESSWFGCCPDGKTEAKGEDFEGCEEIPIKPGDVCGLDKERGSCRNFTVKWFFDMEYGGCSRFWYGGCDGNLNRFTSQDECKAVCVEPEGRDACYLPQVPGPCEGYYPSWHYDPQRESCLQFVYGGCLGNNNRFATRELCENNCLLPDRVDACDQPKTEGPCKGDYSRHYFDKGEEACKQFKYGGCKGNNNNFLTERECEQRCSQEGRMRALLEQCSTRPGDHRKDGVSWDESQCKGADLTRWYYDEEATTCLKFTSGGCGNSNPNRFVSRLECLSVCANNSVAHLSDNEIIQGARLQGKKSAKLVARNSCFLPRHAGPCGEKLARWYYDTNEQRCVPFYYGGCQGNTNRFNTLGDCEKTCPAALLAENTCLQPSAVGDCASYTERYHYDPYEGRCKAFVYSGCGGNSNNFMFIDDCRNKCERSYVPQPVPQSPAEFNTASCFQQPPDSSACYGSDPASIKVKWFYDKNDGVCKQFRWYADCAAQQQSANHFDQRQECEDRCEQAQDTCSLPQVQGPCSGSFPQFYYDLETDTCQLFQYGGCQGNGNRFDTLVQCEQRCKKSPHTGDPYDSDPYRPDPYASPGPGPDQGETEADRQRQAEEERYRQEYYAQQERRRQEEERQRQEEEERRRGGGGYGEDVEQPTLGPYIEQDEICSLPMDIGPCRASVPGFYYDTGARRCQAFIYGGCQGNANRFETEEMCERQCGAFRGEDVCNVGQADPGPCRARLQKWYFSQADRTCQQFFYGGCQGNANRFSSREECESVCHARTELVASNDTISGAAICRLPVDSGPCVDGYKRWFYDKEQNTCIPFGFGGCAGNLNRFTSFDSCLSFCQKALQVQDTNPAKQQNQLPRTRSISEGIGPSYSDNEVDMCADQLQYCKSLQCPYGVQRSETEAGCPQCECQDPCRSFQCPEDEQCAVDIQKSAPSQRHSQPRFRPVCRKRNKPGECPTLYGSSSFGRIGTCAQECMSDADCSAELKCCSNGCGFSCLLPQVERTEPDRPQVAPPLTYGGNAHTQPPRILTSRTEVEAEEGSLASLECICRGNPIPQIHWRFNNAEVSVDSGRFRALQDGSVLQIIGVHKRDEGVYSCVAENGVGRPAVLDITLVVTEPVPRQASIVEQDTEPNVIVSLGSAASLRCFAMGWPRPSVTWWRGEKMLPFSSERFEQLRDYSLLIRLVSLRDLGPYTCQAYNGQGKAASWTVTVQTLGPVSTSASGEDREYLQYVISGGRRPVYIGGNFTTVGGRPVRPPARPLTTTTTTTERVIVPNYLVPLRTSIQLDKTLHPVGNDISIPCEVEGYPQPSVHWYHDSLPLKDSSDQRIKIFNQNELRIYNATTQDSGNYRCDAVNEYGSSSSSVTIVVEGVYLHPNCTDNPFFANCKLIVKANYCTNKYYARFCCKSCTFAGQLPPFGPHLQEYGQAYFRRGQVEYAPTNLQNLKTSNSNPNQVS